MASARYQPHLEPTATVLRAAVEAAGLTRVDVAKHLGLSQSAISTMLHAKSPLTAERARKLGALLNIDPATIVSPPVTRKPRSGKRPGNGPAERALVLHESSASPPVTLHLKPTPVMAMRLLSDGSANVSLDVTLSAARGATLFRLLLDFEMTEIGAQ
jgi:transcriptional regulator with XRE-family HTH domain